MNSIWTHHGSNSVGPILTFSAQGGLKAHLNGHGGCGEGDAKCSRGNVWQQKKGRAAGSQELRIKGGCIPQNLERDPSGLWPNGLSCFIQVNLALAGLLCTALPQCDFPHIHLSQPSYFWDQHYLKHCHTTKTTYLLQKMLFN